MLGKKALAEGFQWQRIHQRTSLFNYRHLILRNITISINMLAVFVCKKWWHSPLPISRLVQIPRMFESFSFDQGNDFRQTEIEHTYIFLFLVRISFHLVSSYLNRPRMCSHAFLFNDLIEQIRAWLVMHQLFEPFGHAVFTTTHSRFWLEVSLISC